MKKIICALLALVMCASITACKEETDSETATDSTPHVAVSTTTTTTPEDTTTKASETSTTKTTETSKVPDVTTTTKVPETSKAPETTTTRLPETSKIPEITTTPSIEVVETPLVDKDVDALMEDLTNVNAFVDHTSLHSSAMSLWSEKPYADLFVVNNRNMGASETSSFVFYWSMTKPVQLDSYVIRTAADNSDYPGRVPVEWHLMATNNYTLPGDIGADLISPSAVTSYTDLLAAGWVELDYVWDSNIDELTGLTSFGYKIDSDKQGEYQHYCWLITCALTNSIDINYLGLYTASSHNHTFTDATCATPKTCTICGSVAGYTVEMHDYADATCTNPQTCKICGETVGDPISHDYANATCTAPRTCKICGKTKGSAVEHDYQLIASEEPTCWEWGYNEFTCSKCGGFYYENVEPAHNFDDTVCQGCGKTICSTTKGEHDVDRNGVCIHCGAYDSSSLEMPQPFLYFMLNEDGNSYTFVYHPDAYVRDPFRIPSNYSGLPVTEIIIATIEHEYQYSNMSDITVIIPDSITSILGSISSFKTIVVSPENPCYQVIDGVLFDKSGTELLALPSSINVSEYIIPDGITRIGDCAFGYHHELTSITIPNSVTGIGSCLFEGSYNLSSITYNGTIAEWNAIEKDWDWFDMGDWGGVLFPIHCTDGDVENFEY